MYKFTYDDGDYSVQVSLNKEDAHMDEVIQLFEQYLQGIGFVIRNGDYIGLVEGEEVNPKCGCKCAGHGEENVVTKNVGSNFPVI
jgi:hypothetical protein